MISCAVLENEERERERESVCEKVCFHEFSHRIHIPFAVVFFRFVQHGMEVFYGPIPAAFVRRLVDSGIAVCTISSGTGLGLYHDNQTQAVSCVL